LQNYDRENKIKDEAQYVQPVSCFLEQGFQILVQSINCQTKVNLFVL